MSSAPLVLPTLLALATAEKVAAWCGTT